MDKQKDVLSSIQDAIMQTLMKETDILVVSDEAELKIPLQDPIINRLVFGGGFPFGAFLMFTGQPSSYKTTMAISLAKMLKENNDNVAVVFLDSEGSTTQSRLETIGLHGVKPITGITIEKVNSILESLANVKEKNPKYKDAKIVVIWDSIASTPTEAELKTPDINKTIGLKARLLSAYLPRWINGILLKHKITVIAINQLRQLISMGYVPAQSPLKNLSGEKTLPGGNSLLYQANAIIEHKVTRAFTEENSIYGERAYIVQIKTVKNKYFPDNIVIDTVFLPTKGFDPILTQFEFLKKLNYVAASGPVWKFKVDENLFPELANKVSGVSFRLKELKNKIYSDSNFATLWSSLVENVIDKLVENITKTEKTDDKTKELISKITSVQDDIMDVVNESMEESTYLEAEVKDENEEYGEMI